MWICINIPNTSPAIWGEGGGGPTHKQYTTDLYIVTNIKSDYMKASVRILKFVLQEIFSIKS